MNERNECIIRLERIENVLVYTCVHLGTGLSHRNSFFLFSSKWERMLAWLFHRECNYQPVTTFQEPFVPSRSSSLSMRKYAGNRVYCVTRVFVQHAGIHVGIRRVITHRDASRVNWKRPRKCLRINVSGTRNAKYNPIKEIANGRRRNVPS